MASYSKNNPAVAKRLLDSMQNDLRTLSAESKRKHPEVKESAEAVQLKLRAISTKGDNIVAGLLPVSSAIIQPFILGCDTKNPKLLPLCLVALQRLISHEAINVSAASSIVNMLWRLMEGGLEELKLLQTATLLLTINTVVQHESLAKALVLCFRLHFTKDATIIHTAAATIKQLVSAIFERVVKEDQIPTTEPKEEVNIEQLKAGSKTPPNSLRPCAGDAYLLFQDLCQLVNADQPFWLTGMTEMTRTFGLELVESVLTCYSVTFTLHQEFSFMLKERVCPLVIKLFSPSLKYKQGLPATNPSPSITEKPYFPIVMRLLRIVAALIQGYYPLLVTECEIFLSLLVKFLEPEKPMWQRCLALEVLYKLAGHPELVKSFVQSYDMKPHSTKIFRDIINAQGAFIQSQFMNQPGGPAAQTGKVPDTQGTPPAIVGGLPVGGGVSPQPAFLYRGVWIPIVPLPHGTNKQGLLELQDKTEPPVVPDGYGVSLAFRCLMEMARTVQCLVLGDTEEGDPGGRRREVDVTDDNEEDKALHVELINSSWCGVLAALSLLLDASTDESASEMILKAELSYANMCGHLNMGTPRDAFITALCKASLPPHYTLNVLTTQAHSASQKVFNRSTSQDSSLEAQERSQVVAVGTALPTASLPAGAHQGQVVLTAKNIQVMRTLLSLAHCHGDILGTAWHLVLTTLQHLVWILGLKPSMGGSLRAGQQISDRSDSVITTAVMADLPVLGAMLSRLFESSQYLDDVALHHLIDALCKLSAESMELAYSNREPSLFAVVKLLESGLVNLGRVEVLWRPVTAHLLEVCQHPHGEMRAWGAQAVTSLVKAALAYRHDTPLHENLKLQSAILSPLAVLSTIPYSDIRQTQLESVSHVLQNNGDHLMEGWPVVLEVIGAVTRDHGEKLVQMAFQCLQLVVTDFLPIMAAPHLQGVVQVAATFGLQQQELNVSLTAIGLLWNISDFFCQNHQRIKQELDSAPSEPSQSETPTPGKGKAPPPFDALWMCLFSKLGELCVDGRPAVRKSAGQTLFSTISAHGSLLQHDTWHNVLWQVLFPLLENVQKLSSSASTIRDNESTGNILIHHSRDTAEKQWAETRVLTLAGVARTFNAKRKMLQGLGDFSRAWSLLLEHIESSALCRNAEVALAALKSFQEILQIGRPIKVEEGEGLVEPPSHEVMSRTAEKMLCSGEGANCKKPTELCSKGNISDSADSDIPLWSAAWKVWLTIGTEVTRPPIVTPGSEVKLFLPAQNFLTALIQTFPPLFEHIKMRFVSADLQKLCGVLKGTLCVPVSNDASPFIVPASYTEATVTPLQDAALSAMEALIKTVQSGPDTMQGMFPDIYRQLLTFITFGVNAPKFGDVEASTYGMTRGGPKSDWIMMNFVPFAERAVTLTVDLYRATASHSAVITAHILQEILKTFRLPLGLKYSCPSPSTWMLVADSLFVVLNTGLPVARAHGKAFQGMWSELANLFESFLFTPHSCPAHLSVEDFQRDEAMDCRLVQLVRLDILPHAAALPGDFMVKVMDILNKGSIHATTSDSFVDTDSSRKLREDFARTCFETLLQFSFVSDTVTEQGQLTRLAVMSLLRRCREVVTRYVEDERLSGKCPLPRPRLAEMSSVLKAITVLLQSLKKAPSDNIEPAVWDQVIQLYPALVECTTSPSPQVSKALRDALHEFCDLLAPPTNPVMNGR